METHRFVHSPGYGQFYLQDPVHYDVTATSTFSKEDIERGFHVGAGILSVFVISQWTEIPIEAQVFPDPPPVDGVSQWDRIIECSLEVRSDYLALAGCPDGPQYGTFGRISVAPGHYGVRVHYGGQDTTDDKGETADFYLIQIWPSQPFESRVRKESGLQCRC
jgi:hypothetical protein